MNLLLSDIEMRLPGQAGTLFSLPSLEVASGTRLLIHGPSGAGKTTLLHLMCGQFLPSAGRVRLGDLELTELSAAARARARRARVGIIFQRGNLVEHLTVAENIALGIAPGTPTRLRTEQALRRLDLTHMAPRRAGLLSPGEQQRVAVARIVAAEPALVLADEPTSSLDGPNTDAVMEALWEVTEGRTLVVVSHDPRILPRFEGTADAVRDFSDLVTRPGAAAA